MKLRVAIQSAVYFAPGRGRAPAHVALVVVVLFSCFFFAAICEAQTAAHTSLTATEAQINRLVEQLGAPRYRDRKLAESRLEELGLLAFEALEDQRDNENIEIRLGAKRLVEKLRKRFLTEGVDPAFRFYLENYNQYIGDRRKDVVLFLGSMLPQQAGNELARIARIEADSSTSLYAALAFMQVPYSTNKQHRDAYADSIQSAIGFGNRRAIKALRLYAAALRGEAFEGEQPAAVWQRWIDEEKQRISQQQSEPGALPIVPLMDRIRGDLLAMAGDDEGAAEARSILSSGGFADDRALVEWLNWLLDRAAWSSIVEFADANKEEVEKRAVLLYGLAEAQQQLGDEKGAEATLQKALKVSPLDDDFERYAAAVFLEENRGKFDWAEREYRHVIEHAGESSSRRLVCYYRLATMFHGLGRDLEAYETLKAWFDEIEASETVRTVSNETYGDSMDGIRARMHLFRANHFRHAGDVKKQQAELLKAVELDPTEADAIIEMYRIDTDDETWKRKATRAIKKAAAIFSREINRYRSEYESPEGSRADAQRELSSALNQMAWLVSNTEGDYQEALRLSRTSLELRPGDSGLMDTLGRCYYSVEDFENAVKYQRWAIERMPHNDLMKKQLALFERALEDARSSETNDDQ